MLDLQKFENHVGTDFEQIMTYKRFGQIFNMVPELFGSVPRFIQLTPNLLGELDQSYIDDCVVPPEVRFIYNCATEDKLEWIYLIIDNLGDNSKIVAVLYKSVCLNTGEKFRNLHVIDHTYWTYELNLINLHCSNIVKLKPNISSNKTKSNISFDDLLSDDPIVGHYYYVHDASGQQVKARFSSNNGNTRTWFNREGVEVFPFYDQNHIISPAEEYVCHTCESGIMITKIDKEGRCPTEYSVCNICGRESIDKDQILRNEKSNKIKFSGKRKDISEGKYFSNKQNKKT